MEPSVCACFDSHNLNVDIVITPSGLSLSHLLDPGQSTKIRGGNDGDSEDDDEDGAVSDEHLLVMLLLLVSIFGSALSSSRGRTSLA